MLNVQSSLFIHSHLTRVITILPLVHKMGTVVYIIIKSTYWNVKLVYFMCEEKNLTELESTVTLLHQQFLNTYCRFIRSC